MGSFYSTNSLNEVPEISNVFDINKKNTGNVTILCKSTKEVKNEIYNNTNTILYLLQNINKTNK